jgi:hypothetical protein
VQLFGMCIGHYAALPPVQFDPHWPHSHAPCMSSPPPFASPCRTHALQHTLLATQTTVEVTTTCLDYLRSHTRAMRPSTASPIDALHACSQLHIGCGALAPRSQTTHGNTRCSQDSNLGSGNHDMSWLSAVAYTNDAPIHGLTDRPPRLRRGYVRH